VKHPRGEHQGRSADRGLGTCNGRGGGCVARPRGRFSAAAGSPSGGKPEPPEIPTTPTFRISAVGDGIQPGLEAASGLDAVARLSGYTQNTESSSWRGRYQWRFDGRTASPEFPAVRAYTPSMSVAETRQPHRAYADAHRTTSASSGYRIVPPTTSSNWQARRGQRRMGNQANNDIAASGALAPAP